MRGRRRYWIVGLSGTAVAVAVALVLWLTRPPQIVLSMRPAHPLMLDACAAEAHAQGYSLLAGKDLCRAGASVPWYHAVLTNRGGYAQVSCSATGYDSHSLVAFNGLLGLELFGIRGLFAPGHQTIRFYWYLPEAASAPIKRYVATCSVEPYP